MLGIHLIPFSFSFTLVLSLAFLICFIYRTQSSNQTFPAHIILSNVILIVIVTLKMLNVFMRDNMLK